MNKIKELVFDLPEQYQIIYGYPEFDNNPSRACVDRAELLIDLVKKLIEHYQRPIKVLDLGCAQGYFCFRLAELGCEVVGVDFLDKNIAVCSELGMQNASLKCKFEIGDVVDKIESIQAGDFDLVYSFSVLHHVCHFRGKDFVQQKLVELSHKCDVFLYEAALKSEPLYWAPSLPEEAYELIQDFDFYRELQQFGTHLSDIVRPLYFCSNKFLYLSGALSAFDSVSYKAHEQHDVVHKETRRYYYTKSKFFKVYYFKGLHAQDNIKQIQNEIEIYSSGKLDNLSNYVPIFLRGELFNDLGYVATSKISGEIVSKLQSVGNFKLEDGFIHNLMTFLVELENMNLFYNDLRTWNMMLDNDGKLKIIDVASIQNLKKDLDWPSNIYISFILFIYELYNGSLLREDLLRRFRVSPVWLNESTGKWMQELWSIPYNQWSFKLIQELHSVDYLECKGFVINPLNIYLWMGIVEEFTYRSTGYSNLYESIQVNKLEITRLHSECANRDGEISRLHRECVNRDGEISRLNSECANRDIEINRLHNECAVRDTEIGRLHSEIHLRYAEIERLSTHIGSIYSTLSWKITKPLRLLKIGIKKTIYMPRQLVSRTKRLVKRVIIKVAKKIATINIIKRVGKSYLRNHPRLKMKIKRKMIEKGLWGNPVIFASYSNKADNIDCDRKDISALSPKALQVYNQLKQIYQQRHGGV